MFIRQLLYGEVDSVSLIGSDNYMGFSYEEEEEKKRRQISRKSDRYKDIFYYEVQYF